MSRRTDRERGALIARDAALYNNTPQLFDDPDSRALDALWSSIFDASEQALAEERWARLATARA